MCAAIGKLALNATDGDDCSSIEYWDIGYLDDNDADTAHNQVKERGDSLFQPELLRIWKIMEINSQGIGLLLRLKLNMKNRVSNRITLQLIDRPQRRAHISA